MTDVGASLKSTVSIVIPSNPDLTIVTLIPFDSFRYASAGFYNPLHPTRLTFPEDGKYIVGYSVVFQYNINGQRASYLMLTPFSGGGPITVLKEIYYSPQNGATDAQTLHRERVKKFSAGDYVELGVAQDSGGNLNILNTETFEGVPDFYQEFSPILYAQRIG